MAKFVRYLATPRAWKELGDLARFEGQPLAAVDTALRNAGAIPYTIRPSYNKDRGVGVYIRFEADYIPASVLTAVGVDAEAVALPDRRDAVFASQLYTSMIVNASQQLAVAQGIVSLPAHRRRQLQAT